MIALKPRFVLLAAFCTFAAVQGGAIPVEMRALSSSSSTQHHPSSGGASVHVGGGDHHNSTSARNGTVPSTESRNRKDRHHHHGRTSGAQADAHTVSGSISSREPHHHHHHHDKKEYDGLSSSPGDHASELSARHHHHHHDSDGHSVVITGSDDHVHVNRELTARHHHHHDDHRHHTRRAKEPVWDPLDPLVAVDSTSLGDNQGPTELNSQPLILRSPHHHHDDHDRDHEKVVVEGTDDHVHVQRRGQPQGIFHTKRDNGMAGVPGSVDIVMVNPTPQRIASLVITAQDNSASSNSTSNGTATSSDPFVLDASNTTHTQFYLVANPDSNASSDLPSNKVMVTLQAPVFQPLVAEIVPYCATFSRNPQAPEAISMRECSEDLMNADNNSSSQASQAFTYDPSNGVISPMWSTTSDGDSSPASPDPSGGNALSAQSDFVVAHGLHEFIVGDATGMSTSTSGEPSTIDGSASSTSTAPISTTTDDASSSATDSNSADSDMPTMSTSESTSTLTATETETATTTLTSSSDPTSTSSTTISAATATATSGNVSPQDVTLVFTPAAPAVPIDQGPATSFQPLEGGIPAPPTDQQTDDATTTTPTGQAQTPSSSDPSTTSDTSFQATSTGDSVGTATMSMPTSSSSITTSLTSDAPTSTATDNGATMSTDTMATSTTSADSDDLFASLSMASARASESSSEASTRTVTMTVTASKEGSSPASATASPTAGPSLFDADSIERMFNSYQ